MGFVHLCPLSSVDGFPGEHTRRCPSALAPPTQQALFHLLPLAFLPRFIRYLLLWMVVVASRQNHHLCPVAISRLPGSNPCTSHLCAGVLPSHPLNFGFLPGKLGLGLAVPRGWFFFCGLFLQEPGAHFLRIRQRCRKKPTQRGGSLPATCLLGKGKAVFTNSYPTFQQPSSEA